jgi:hypothetical protein
MKMLRTIVTCVLALSLATAATAGDLRDSAAQAATAAAQTAQPSKAPSRKALVYTGGALFAAGMTTALYGFMSSGNGDYAQFGEATSRNKALGAAGLAAAFAGGTIMFLGSRSRFAPSSVAVNGAGLSVEKMVSW